MANVAIQSQALNIPLRPDTDALYDKLVSNVTNNGDQSRIWTDTITAATGSFILRAISSVGGDLMFAAERAQHEVFPQTARRPSSIYAAARMLGVHIQRKIPSTIAATIARATVVGTRTIPEYSSWSVGGTRFFNREKIFFAQDVEALDINLHRGELASQTFLSDGKARQSFIVGPSGFRVSDSDILCYVTDTVTQPAIPSVQYTVTKEGIWEYEPTSKVTQITTTVDGSCKAEFGNGVSGYIPPIGHEIRFNYVLVQVDPALENNLNQIPAGTEIYCLSDNQVGGITTGTVSSPTNERSPAFYAANAPYMRSGKKFGNTRDNMRGLALEYPGVIDAKLRGQAEINPADLRLMNTIECCLLTQTVWSTSEKNQFIRFMHKNSCSTRHFVIRDARPTAIDISLRLLIAARAQRDSVFNQATAIVNDMFTLDENSLGARFSEGDLGADMIRLITDPYGRLVTYARVESPKDVQLDFDQYFVKGSVSINIEYDPSDNFRIVRGTAVPGNRIGTIG